MTQIAWDKIIGLKPVGGFLCYPPAKAGGNSESPAFFELPPAK
jgi:hypothetical protein